MSENEFVKEITNIDEDFAQWYTDICLKAELADYTASKGFVAIRPYGYAIYENISNYEDKEFKKLGVQNLTMPLLIPESLLNKEKDHVEGFAPEVAWVTMGGNEELEERLCVRPTSEVIFSTMYAKWLKSWRDLPFLYNQWGSVVRWEKETRPFLRTREFFWHEGHTIHETGEEAKQFCMKILDIYTDVIENLLAIPVTRGVKTDSEKFAGAVSTFTVETLMRDGKALQAGTSHYLGENFSKAFNITFQDREGKQAYPHYTTWATTSRLIGAIIMAHGDNRGLKLPPRIAPIQVVIVPIAQEKGNVLEEAGKLKDKLSKDFRVKLDDRDNYTPGNKFNYWEMKGVPVRLEIGPKDIEKGEVVLVRRDTFEKKSVKMEDVETELAKMMDEIHNNMFETCLRRQEEKTTVVHNMDELVKTINENQGYLKAMWCGDASCEEKIKDLTAVKSRCIPFEEEHLDDKCVCCGKPAKHMVVWGRQY